MHILHEIAQNKQRPLIVAAGGAHIRHVVQRLQQCGYTLKRSIGENFKTFLTVGSRSPKLPFPSALDLETIFNNLEPTKSEYYVQKTKNFFSILGQKNRFVGIYFSTFSNEEYRKKLFSASLGKKASLLNILFSINRGK